MSKKTALVKTKVPQMVRYREGKSGREWETQVGKPNGCFGLPGHPDKSFSYQSLYDFLAKSLPLVTVVGANEISADTIQPEDMATLLTTLTDGDKPRSTKKKKSVAKSGKKAHVKKAPVKKKKAFRLRKELAGTV